MRVVTDTGKTLADVRQYTDYDAGPDLAQRPTALVRPAHRISQ